MSAALSSIFRMDSISTSYRVQSPALGRSNVPTGSQGHRVQGTGCRVGRVGRVGRVDTG